jgi:two-component system OmpR family sensor kinase
MRRPRGLRRRLVARARRRSLRARLVVGVLVLATLGLLVADTAAVVLLRSYLTERIDQQLTRAQARLALAEAQGFDPQQLLALAGQEAASQALGGLLSDYLVEHRDADGKPLTRFTGALQPSPPPRLPPLALPQARELAGRPFEVGAQGSGRSPGYRVLVRVRPGDQGSVILAVDLASRAATLRRLVAIEAAASLLVLALVALLGVAVVRVGLRPLVEVERTAETIIAAGDLSRRVPAGPDRRTEIGRLAATLNTMLAQIQRAFRQRADSEARLRRFVADASHELRTPLAGIRGLTELYRQGAVRDPDEVGGLLGRIEAEATRMGLLVEDLLLLARLDQERPLDQEPVDLVPIAADAVEQARAVDPDRPLELVLLPQAGADGTPTPVVLGDEPRLRQVAANLVGNALAHTPPGTPVTVRVGTVQHGPTGTAGLLEVADRGPGLAPGQAERVFERFYRADPARSREHDRHPGGGAGLGLAIVAAIVAAHHGHVEHTPTPSGGATFRVLLPTARQDPTGPKPPPR